MCCGGHRGLNLYKNFGATCTRGPLSTYLIHKLSFFIPVDTVWLSVLNFIFILTPHTYIIDYIRTESKLIEKICVKSSSYSSSLLIRLLILLRFFFSFFGSAMIEREILYLTYEAAGRANRERECVCVLSKQMVCNSLA